ncbi:serine hydrolase domain-containing protein [Actinomadura napierensis]|uniref:Serine hydrolase domain-containing protein n=1 Tax=Actinomadura napierensis TaxID=267854 RepID=A0ABN2XVK2_9ACTN
MTTIHGFADEGFGPVADAFAANVAGGAELGAACAVRHRDRLVVDLHAGLADARTGRAWTDGTLVVGYSVTKGLVALCAQIARARGLLDLDAPVGEIRPEFAVKGKENVRIRDLFSHRSGLMALDADLSFADVAAWTPVVRAIERQEPLWEPGTAFAYHPLTFGWLTGEVLRRATGRTPGALVAEWLAGPFGADAWIGLPEEQEHRVARIEPPEADPRDTAWMEAALARPAVVRSMTLGGAFPPLLIEDGHPGDLNARAARAVEIPAAGGVLSAKALATIYAAAVTEVGGHRLLDDAGVADALAVRSSGESWPGALAHPDMRFSTGFMLDGIAHRPLLSDASFGHDGATGSLGFADADAEVGFGYLNNRFGGIADERANRLTAALRRSLGS